MAQIPKSLSGEGGGNLPGMLAAIREIVGGTGLVHSANLAIGTVAATAVKYDAFTVVFDGVPERIAAGEEAFTATTHDIADPTALPREAIYVLSVATGGAVTITKGADAAAGAAVAPATPADEVKLGEVKVQHDGTAIFDATTNTLDAAHLTTTFASAKPLMAA